MTHPNEVGLRNERVQWLLAEEQRKLANKVNKVDKIMKTNESCETKLDDQPTLETFSKCSKTELQAFVHARKFDRLDGPARDENWSWPNKGKLADAENGTDNLIRRAFDCRQKPVILSPPASQSTAASSPVANTRHKDADVVCVSPQQTECFNSTMASECLEMEMWMKEVDIALNPNQHNKVVEIDSAALERADPLQRHLEK